MTTTIKQSTAIGRVKDMKYWVGHRERSADKAVFEQSPDVFINKYIFKVF